MFYWLLESVSKPTVTDKRLLTMNTLQSARLVRAHNWAKKWNKCLLLLKIIIHHFAVEVYMEAFLVQNFPQSWGLSPLAGVWCPALPTCFLTSMELQIAWQHVSLLLRPQCLELKAKFKTHSMIVVLFLQTANVQTHTVLIHKFPLKQTHHSFKNNLWHRTSCRSPSVLLKDLFEL